MNITSTAVTTTATETTKQAEYQIEYSVKEGQITRMQVDLFSLQEKRHIGYIIQEAESLHCSLPADTVTAPIFTDFDNIVAQIKQSLTSKS